MTSRFYSPESIVLHAYAVQEKAFYSAVPFALVFIALAILGEWRWAVVMVILGSLALGASVGAWFVAQRFRD